MRPTLSPYFKTFLVGLPFVYCESLKEFIFHYNALKRQNKKINKFSDNEVDQNRRHYCVVCIQFIENKGNSKFIFVVFPVVHYILQIIWYYEII